MLEELFICGKTGGSLTPSSFNGLNIEAMKMIINIISTLYIIYYMTVFFIIGDGNFMNYRTEAIILIFILVAVLYVNKK